MPTYNEVLNLQHSVWALLEQNRQVDLLIVDDSSPDGTGDLADDLAQTSPRINVLHRKGKNGLGKAYLAGFDWAFTKDYDLIVEMDADGSHRAEDLPTLLAAASTSDLVIGSRWIKGGKLLNWPFSRILISRIGNFYTRFMLGLGVKDVTAGFRVYRKTFLEQLPLNQVASSGYSFQVEMTLLTKRAGGRITEVPITFIERELGASKMSREIVLEAMSRVTKWGFARVLGKQRNREF